MPTNSPAPCSSSSHRRGLGRAHPERRLGAPILSINDLASRLGVTKAELRRHTNRIDGRNGKYRAFSVSRSSRGNVVRQVRDPSPDLKAVQRRINAKILVPLVDTRIAHGGVRGRSPRTNARVHLGRTVVATVDIKRFFPSLRPIKVYSYFREHLGYGREVAAILTRLVTLEGGIPLGAPTSMSMANLLMEDVDTLARREGEAHGLAVTRYVDDFAFSGADPRPMINVIGRVLSQQGLRIHRQRKDGSSKLKMMSNWSPQRVTGLNVNHPSDPTVPRDARDSIRAAIFATSKIPPGPERDASVQSIKGKIAHVRSLHPGHADRLLKQLAHQIP